MAKKGKLKVDNSEKDAPIATDQSEASETTKGKKQKKVYN